MLNRFVGGSAIVRVRSRRMEHRRTDGSSVLYTLKVTYCVRSTRCWLVEMEIMRVSAQEHYWRAAEKDDKFFIRHDNLSTPDVLRYIYAVDMIWLWRLIVIGE